MSKLEHNRFLQALDNVEDVQRQYLMTILSKNKTTKYGKRYDFADISSVNQFQASVPLSNYETYKPYIEDIAQGKQGVLTQEPVLLFEPSSGTSSSSKLIPYTKSLKTEFQRGISPWIVSLYKRKPELMNGSAYWSISPPTTKERYFNKVPVGFDQDTEYLGFIGSYLYEHIAAVPQRVASTTDIDTFRHMTLVYLLAAEDLVLISIWSPTFLSLLLKTFLKNPDEILQLLAKSKLPGAKNRVEEIRRMIQDEREDDLFVRIWPKLSVISCWTHGLSENYSRQIGTIFPNVEIQGKGLLATEAFVSLPLLPEYDPVLSVRSHFFEFRNPENGEILPAHEVKEGKVYSVIVTTGGGLYRYQLEDLIEVTGFYHKIPTLRFVSKEAVSDLFGEKLHIDHVQRAVTDVLTGCSITPIFTLLAPVEDQKNQIAYSLFLDTENISIEQAGYIITNLEKLLCENFHYSHCRKMEQLGPVRLFLLDHSTEMPEEIFIREMQNRGLKLGDIKPSILDNETGWERRFRGHFFDAYIHPGDHLY